jgi:hypothetical protein
VGPLFDVTAVRLEINTNASPTAVKFLAYPITTIFSVACKRKSAQIAARAQLLPSIDRDQVPNY